MFRIENNEIELTRGDTAIIDFKLLDIDGNLVDLSDFEGELVFTVKSGVYTNKKSISKEIVDGVLYLEPGDTEDLSYGKYVYDVQLKLPNGHTGTVIPPHTLKILSEVNF